MSIGSQFKKRLLIFNEVTDICSDFLQNIVSFSFSFFLLRFYTAGIFWIQLAICLSRSPIRLSLER